MTNMLTDTDLTVIEDLDFEPGCELLPGCSNEPRWDVRTRQDCCGATSDKRSCDRCLGKLREFLAKRAPNFWGCKICAGISTDQLCIIDRIEPLR